FAAGRSTPSFPTRLSDVALSPLPFVEVDSGFGFIVERTRETKPSETLQISAMALSLSVQNVASASSVWTALRFFVLVRPPQAGVVVGPGSFRQGVPKRALPDQAGHGLAALRLERLEGVPAIGEPAFAVLIQDNLCRRQRI